jgi:hypothetical protein
MLKPGWAIGIAACGTKIGLGAGATVAGAAVEPQKAPRHNRSRMRRKMPQPLVLVTSMTKTNNTMIFFIATTPQQPSRCSRGEAIRG